MRYKLETTSGFGINLLTFIPALILFFVVAYDFEKRRKGLAPDRMHWADYVMVRYLGYVCVR